MSIDPGSVLVAGTVATLAGSLVLVVVRSRGGVPLSVPLALGERLGDDAAAGLAAGVVLHIAAGLAWAFASAGLWSVLGWPIVPYSGALLGFAQWSVAEVAIGAAARRVPLAGRSAFGPRRESTALMLSHLVYGVVLGAVYRPGA